MGVMNSPNMENSSVRNGSIDTHVNESVQITTYTLKEDENLNVGFLEDFDSYLEDINDRLTISRMVSDSVVKGIVNAVEQEATEKVDCDECGVGRLKETYRICLVGSNNNDSLGLPCMCNGTSSKFSGAFLEHDRMRESLGRLRNAAKEQFNTLRKEVDKFRGLCSLRRISSGSELVGLGGILQDNIPTNRMNVDITFDSLNTTLDTSFKHMDDVVCMSKALLWQWQHDHEFQKEVQDMVITTCVRSLKDDFEKQLWDQNARFCGDESLLRLEKIKEMSSLRLELETISNSLSVTETAQPTYYGSLEVVDEGKKFFDHLHQKMSGHHVSSCSIREGNGKHEESVITVPENSDGYQLQHMNKDELMNYFKIEMSKMKRYHDYKMHEKTEELFTLKREHLNERGSSMPLRKDKEFDVLRKKIPVVILKLDKILLENEKLMALDNDSSNFGNIKEKLDSLFLENHRLRDLVTDNKKEVHRLSSLVSDAEEKMLQQSLAEGKLLEMIATLECAIEDARIEASISQDVYMCLLKCQIEMISETSEMEHGIVHEVYEVIFKDIAQKLAPSGMYDFEDVDIESFITQGVCEVVFREASEETEEQLSRLKMKYNSENEARVSLELSALQNDRALRIEVAEKERLKQEMLVLEALVKEKEKLGHEVEAELAKRTEQYQLASQELDNLREQTRQQMKVIMERSLESEVMKSDLDESRKHSGLLAVEIHELNQKLELAKEELREAYHEKKRLLTVTHEKQSIICMFEAKDKEHRKQMDMAIVLLNGLVQAIDRFECRVEEMVIKDKLRLENLSGQLSSLNQKASALKIMEFVYKKRLEKKRSDLQKAETEVDLLGNEVDYLVNLLEKIYIALDHYSPILQHYPGIIEILKLVKRKLSGESTN